MRGGGPKLLKELPTMFFLLVGVFHFPPPSHLLFFSFKPSNHTFILPKNFFKTRIYYLCRYLFPNTVSSSVIQHRKYVSKKESSISQAIINFPPLIPGGEELLRRAVVPSRRAHGAWGGRGGGRQEGGQGGDGARRQGHDAAGGGVSR